MENQSTPQQTTLPPTPMPDHYQGKGALDAFLNLLSLVTLGWTAISFGGVMFQIINKFFNPKRYVYGFEGYYSGALKFNIASLIIVMPIFLILTGILHKQYKEKKLNEQSGIHRWLTYVMLFIAFCNIIGSLVALVSKFLDGIFFSAFILKALTIFVIASGIFGYYWYDLRRKHYDVRATISLVSSVAVTVLSIGVVVGGFLIIGSPQTARMLNFDRQRVQDLNEMRWSIDDYYRTHKKLPTDLREPQFQQFKDPETQESYQYKVVDPENFEVCADFSLDYKVEEGEYPYPRGSDAWNYHKAGRQCYKVTVSSPPNPPKQDYSQPLPAVPVN